MLLIQSECDYFVPKEFAMSENRSKSYSAKHPEGTQMDGTIMQAVASRLNKGKISCDAAHDIAAALATTPRNVGIATDLHEARIIKCQLGLFGCSKTNKDTQKLQQVPSELKGAIESALDNGRLPCIKAWRIAEKHGQPRKAVGHACETLNIKISQCQLGAF